MAMFKTHSVVTLRPEQNDRYVQLIDLNETCCTLLKWHRQTFVSVGSVDNSALVQVITWRPIAYKQLQEAMLTQYTDACMRHDVSMNNGFS